MAKVVQTAPAQVGSLNGPSLPTASAMAAIGQVVSREASPPERTIVANFHQGKKPTGSPETRQTLRYLTAGFEADKMGNSKKALAEYEKGFGALQKAFVGAFDAELRADACPVDKVAKSQNDLGVFAWLALAQGVRSIRLRWLTKADPAFQSDQVKNEVVDLSLMYLNRKGLALKHQADAARNGGDFDKALKGYEEASKYFFGAHEVDPNYGPAVYNIAANIKCKADVSWHNQEQTTNTALNWLERALPLGNGKVDFAVLAKQDTDWNNLRTDSRFRGLVGLPELPEPPPVRAGLDTNRAPDAPRHLGRDRTPLEYAPSPDPNRPPLRYDSSSWIQGKEPTIGYYPA